MSHNNIFDKYVEPVEAAEFLRELADRAERHDGLVYVDVTLSFLDKKDKSWPTRNA